MENMEFTIPETLGGVGLRIRPTRSSSGELYFTVDVTGTNSICATRTDVYAYGAEGLVALFETMARNWKGWNEALRWESVEGDFGLSCTMDLTGHVRVAVVLKASIDVDYWQVQATVLTEAGQLDALAACARKLVEWKRRA